MIGLIGRIGRLMSCFRTGGGGGGPPATPEIELTDDDGTTYLADDDGTTLLTDD